MESAHSSMPRGGERTVVAYPGDTHTDWSSHECITHAEAAKRIATLLGYRFGGYFEPGRRYDGRLYMVPGETVVTLERAHALGIHDEHDLFGGVVPFPFVATKTITHPLITAHAAAPTGWSAQFARRVQEVVLPGYSAFDLRDALEAGRQLLRQGPVRLKKADGIGGIGQTVANDLAQLEEQCHAFDVEQVLHKGLVLERNLAQVVTLSVGQVRIGALTATYYGTQRLTTNNRGAEVYGGSDLVIARGDFDALLRLDLDERMHTAIAQARTYHAAAVASFAGMFASRCNYDIAQGCDDEGRWRSGVLEQSWRIGGASGAEIAALEAFAADPGCRLIRASTTEVYGDDPSVPPDAIVYFSGVDARAGPLTKYSQLKTNAYP